MSKKEVSQKGRMGVISVIAYLEDLVSAMKAGSVRIQRGEEHVTLRPASPMEVRIEAKRRKGKESLTIELSWRAEWKQ